MSLEIDGLVRRFGETTALDGMSFAVPDGSLFGFVGRNGAGKTTTMRIVLGVLAADGGEVRWRGAVVDRETISRFGYMPEERGLYPKMKVRDQLLHFARLHGRDGATIDDLLERLGVAQHATDAVETLSLGNQQRVQLALAMVHDPELLVLDEPFSGLDPIGVDALASVLQERVAAGVTVVFSSHQLELVERLCDHIAIVEAGRLVAQGTVPDLRHSADPRERWELEVDGELEVVASDDGQALLDAARARGTVGRFARHEPPLAELFREVIR